MFTLVPFLVLFIKYGTKLGNETLIPNGFFFLAGISYFVYRMLDEMDGKQARRTGNSSPLGLLFDHGCDAFSMGLQVMVIAKTF